MLLIHINIFLIIELNELTILRYFPLELGFVILLITSVSCCVDASAFQSV